MKTGDSHWGSPEYQRPARRHDTYRRAPFDLIVYDGDSAVREKSVPLYGLVFTFAIGRPGRNASGARDSVPDHRWCPDGKGKAIPKPGIPDAAKAVKAYGKVSVRVLIDESGS